LPMEVEVPDKEELLFVRGPRWEGIPSMMSKPSSEARPPDVCEKLFDESPLGRAVSSPSGLSGGVWKCSD
jgi:hypothetical protein